MSITDARQYLRTGNTGWLGDHGWDMSQPYDVCWLDCDKPGYRQVWVYRRQHLHICLCARHATVLENGCWAGNYRGAPLPKGSIATAWPWLSQDMATGLVA